MNQNKLIKFEYENRELLVGKLHRCFEKVCLKKSGFKFCVDEIIINILKRKMRTTAEYIHVCYQIFQDSILASKELNLEAENNICECG